MSITFQNQDYNFKLKHKVKLKAWISATIDAENKKKGDIAFVFTNDANLLNINVKFLNHNSYTDIITFDYCEENTVNGDIIISVERVTENAKKYKVDFETELRRVMIHGVLHLTGYKDKTKKDAELMRKKEDLAIRKFAIAGI